MPYLANQNEILQDEVASADRKYDQLLDENEKLEIKIEDLEDENSDLRAAVNIWERYEKKDLEDMVEELQIRVAQLESDNEELEYRLNSDQKNPTRAYPYSEMRDGRF